MAITENYHTHTRRCNHAVGDIDDYACEAVKEGLKILGISDHIPFPDGRWPETRMCYSDLEIYENEIEEARKKYPGLTILKSFECEYFREDHEYFESFLKNRGYDYLISGSHWVIGDDGEWFDFIDRPEVLKVYEKIIIRAMESKLFAFIAHPDMCFADYKIWDKHAEDFTRNICEAAVENNIPLEINGYGLRKHMVTTPEGKRHKYPVDRFWEIAGEYDILAVCNSDAHKPEDVAANIDDCIDIAGRYGIRVADMKEIIFNSTIKS